MTEKTLLMSRFIDRLTDRLGNLVAWLTFFMVLTGVVIVVQRYMFDIGFMWLQESMQYMHSLVFLVGASYALKHDAHVRLDVFYAKLSQERQALIDLLGCTLCIFPLCILTLVSSYDYVIHSWEDFEGSAYAGGLPAVFLLKSFIWVFAILLIFQSLSKVVQAVAVLRHRQHPPPIKE